MNINKPKKSVACYPQIRHTAGEEYQHPSPDAYYDPYPSPDPYDPHYPSHQGKGYDPHVNWRQPGRGHAARGRGVRKTQGQHSWFEGPRHHGGREY